MDSQAMTKRAPPLPRRSPRAAALMRLVQGLLTFLLVLGGSSALADHMNGSYTGTGQAAGTSLVIQQRGTTLQGQFSGATQGTLAGQSDGGDSVTGTVDIVGIGSMQFQGRWSQGGFNLSVSAQNGTVEYVFTKGGMPQPAPQPNPTPQPQPNPVPQPDPVPPPPPPPVADVAYYLLEAGQTIGPFTREQVLARLASGAARTTDLVWKAGLADWTPIDGLAELSPGQPVQPQPADAMVLGATLGVLAHELGHALIGEFSIPSTGPEEDTADEFSALIMSSITGEDEFSRHPPAVQEFLTKMVSYSTLLWYYDAQNSQKTGQRLPWYDEHSASETRFRNTLCMVYGSDPARFKPVADRVGLPERERGRCERDYDKRFAAWETIIEPFARNLEGDLPRGQPANTPGAKVTVVYEPSSTKTGQTLQPAFQKLQLFEGLAATLERMLVWKRDFRIVFADCGVPNAFYDPGKAQITMCWEGIEHFFWIIAEPEGVPRLPS